MRRLLLPIGIGLASRVLLFSVVTVGLLYGDPIREKEAWRAFPDWPLIDGWVRWDAAWYAGIARDGYIEPDHVVEGEARNTVFFPLYPLCMRALTPVTGNVYLSGLLISNLAFFGALVFVYQLALARFGRGTAIKTAILLAFNPYSLFFSAVYSESLFLTLAAGSFYFAEKERWLTASQFAGLAGLTRVNGFMTAIAVAVMYMRKHRGRLTLVRMTPLILGFVGPFAFLAYLWNRYGTPFEFIHAQLAENWATTGYFWPRNSADALHWLWLLLSVSLSLWAWTRMGPEYGLWGAGMGLSAASHWVGGGRYALVVFPASIMLARLLRNNNLFTLVLIYFIHQLLTFALRFSHWRWVA